MWKPKSYVVRVWRRGVRDDAEVLGTVEELDEGQEQTCETVEEFLEALRAQRRRHLRRKRTFADHEELRRILASF